MEEIAYDVPYFISKYEDSIPYEVKLMMHTEDLIFKCTPESIREASLINKKYILFSHYLLDHIFLLISSYKIRK